MEPTIVYDYDPRNLPQAALAAIGLAMAASAMLEQVIENAIAGCAGLDIEYGMAITTHMATPLRESALRSVAEIRIDDLDDLDMLDRLLDRAKEAFDKRSPLAHREWCRNPHTGELFTVKEHSRTRLEVELVPMTIDQIKRDAMFIYDSALTLYGFFSEKNLLATFPPVPRPRHHKSKAARKKRREGKL